MASQSKSKATSAKAWKKASEDQELELPSGNVALVKRPGLDRLIAMDFIPDSLLPIANKAVEMGKKGIAAEVTSAKQAEMIKDKDTVNDVFTTMDRVAEMVLVQPKVVHHAVALEDVNGKTTWRERTLAEREEYLEEKGLSEDDVLWTDDVDFQDKAFIFQFVVGGTRDLEKFRRETGLAVVDVSPGEDLEDKAV